MPLRTNQARNIIRNRGYRDKLGRRISNPTAYARGMVRKTFSGRSRYGVSRFGSRYGGFRKRFSRRF